MEKEKTDNHLIEEFWVSQGGRAHMEPDIHFYESDWQMLMPVVEKIRGLLEDNRLYTKLNGKKYWEVIEVALSTVSIKAVYIAVTQFIKWYNSQKGETTE